jgi:hypothetical protein
VKGSQLSLLAGRKVVATFVAATQELASTSWQVTGYNNGREAVVSLLLGTDVGSGVGVGTEGGGGCALQGRQILAFLFHDPRRRRAVTARGPMSPVKIALSAVSAINILAGTR